MKLRYFFIWEYEKNQIKTLQKFKTEIDTVNQSFPSKLPIPHIYIHTWKESKYKRKGTQIKKNERFYIKSKT